MFKGNNDNNQNEMETIVGPSVKVKGNFNAQGSVRIEGELEGALSTEQNLIVGNAAKIKANIIANNALIAGTITGNIAVEHELELTESAQILGDITAETLAINAGASINGKVAINRKNEQTTHHKEEKPEPKNKD